MKKINVNLQDSETFETCYIIALNNYEAVFYYVWTDSGEQEALDILVDYLEERGETGYFYDQQEADMMEKFDGMQFITAGNHCHKLDAEHTQITKKWED